MALDFGALPPEVNSARMYAGAGAGPMMAAGSAFSTLSSELSSTAASYEAVISQLTGSEWLGPSSAAMAAAAQPFITWLTTTSGLTQQAATQAMASAAAYETAFAATVPPPAVAANRAQLATLVATNVLGQNTAAIAANEAMYGEMWAQDAAAMFAYAASSAVAAQLTPLTPPAPTTNPAGAGTQAAAVSGANANSAQSTGLNGLLGNLQNSVSSLANPAAATSADATTTPITDLYNSLQGFFGVGAVANSVNTVDVTASWCMMMGMATIPLFAHFAASAPFGFAVGTVDSVTPAADAALGGGILAGAVEPAGFGGGTMLAGMGSASSVGGMSVPAAWSAAVPDATGPATLAGTGWTAAADESTSAVQTLPAGMPAAAAAGRAGLGFGGPRYGVKPIVMPKMVVV